MTAEVVEPGNVGFCTCVPDFCLGVPGDGGDGEGQRVCRACRNLDSEEGCLLDSIGATATCRTCRRPITFETVDVPGYLLRTGWSDRSPRDGLVCFSAIHYRHVPDWVPADEARR